MVSAALKIIKELVHEIFKLQTSIEELRIDAQQKAEKIKILSDKITSYQLHQPMPSRD